MDPTANVDWKDGEEVENDYRAMALVKEHKQQSTLAEIDPMTFGLEDEPVMRSMGGGPTMMMPNEGQEWGLGGLNDNDDLGGLSMLSLEPQYAEGYGNHAKQVYTGLNETPAFDFSPSKPILKEQIVTSSGKKSPPMKLAAAPIFLERYSSFYCKANSSQEVQVNPKTVLQSLATSLRECESNIMKIEIEILKEKNQIRGTAFVQNSPVSFAIQLYKKAPDSGDILVECQRRSGDSFSFQALYRNALTALENAAKEAFVVSELVPVSQASLDKQAALKTTLPLALSRVTLDNDTLEKLLAMSVSTKIDVVTEAVHQLTDLCDTGLENVTLFAKHNSFATVLPTWLQSKSLEVVRCAAKIADRAATNGLQLPSPVKEALETVLNRSDIKTTSNDTNEGESHDALPFIRRQIVANVTHSLQQA